MFAQCSGSVVLLSVALLISHVASTPAVGREKRAQTSELTKNPGKYGDDIYQVGQALDAECKIIEEYGTYRISIYLENEPLRDLDVQSDDSNKGNVSHVFAASDNGKRLRCAVFDYTDVIRFPEISREIQVYWKRPLVSQTEHRQTQAVRFRNIPLPASFEPTIYRNKDSLS